MKLLYCTECHDIVLLTYNLRHCECKKCYGFYADEINAIFCGPGVCVGFNNKSFLDALRNQPEEGMGECFEAFIIPKTVSSIRKVDDIDALSDEYAKTW